MNGTPLRELSLFSGGGGGLLASHLLGWEVIGMAEWDDGARSVLKARIADGSLSDVTLHKDVQEIDPSDYIGKVDIVTGGFPCQPFSNAGKRLGADDERNMWPPTVRILKGTGAPHGFFENVASLLSSGYFGTVLGDLVGAGFHVAWDCVPASAVGAPHIRDRLWIYATKIEEGHPVVTPGELPLLTVATFEDGDWTRTIGKAVWSETDELGEPAKWPRAGLVIGNVAHAMRRSGYPSGTNKYGVWPMPQLPWSAETIQAIEIPRQWATPTATMAKQASLPPSSTKRDGVVGDVMREMGFEDRRRGTKSKWPTPTTHDANRVDQIRTPEELEAARASSSGGCRNLREEATHAEERFPTPTASERAGINPNTGKGGGLSRTLKDREKWPTPTAQDHKVKRTTMGRGVNNPTLQGAVAGLNPKDVERSIAREIWPTPRTKGLYGGTGDYIMMEKLLEQGHSLEEVAAMVERKPETFLKWQAERSAQREMFPTPLAGENRKSSQSMRTVAAGGQSTPPGLAQHVELCEGVLPREFEGIPYEDLPPKVREMFPTPTGGMWKSDVSDPEYAIRGAAIPGRQVSLPMHVQIKGVEADPERFPTPQAYSSRDSNPPGITPLDIKVRGLYQDDPAEEPEIWPTPRTGGGSRPNGKGGKVLAEEVQIAEGVRERGEYVDGRDVFPTPTASDGTGGPGAGPNRQGGDNLRTAIQRFPTPTCSSGGRAGSPGLAAVNAMLRGDDPPYQPMTVDIAVVDELRAAGVKEVVSFRTGEMVLESGERVMWPTPTAAVRGGKELDPDHWIESRDRHAEKGVNKHYHLDVAVQFADQGRSPDEERRTWRTPTSFEGASISDETEVPSNYKRPLYDQVAGREWEDTAKVGEAISPAPVERMFEADAVPTVWPTPNASSGLRGGGHAEAAYRELVAGGEDPEEVRAMLDTRPGSNDRFQTPTASDAKAAGNDGFSPLGRQLDAAPKRSGLLNPEWVAWLMGWPIGWTSPDPLPAETMVEWRSTTVGRSWWDVEPETVPRLTPKGETAGSRTTRLKALGNGQVSLCAARSYQVLSEVLKGGLIRASEGDPEVGLHDLFGL